MPRDNYDTDPFVSFRFKVVLGDAEVACSDITIPEGTTEPVDYRTGTDPNYMRKLSGLNAGGNITLKRGITATTALNEWYQKIYDEGALNNRRDCQIFLLNEAGDDAYAEWAITDAWPTKYEVSELSASASEVVFETLELVCETLTRKK